jgi:hypothetical protein
MHFSVGTEHLITITRSRSRVPISRTESHYQIFRKLVALDFTCIQKVLELKVRPIGINEYKLIFNALPPGDVE